MGKITKVLLSLAWIGLALILAACAEEGEDPVITTVPATDAPPQASADSSGDPLPELGPPPTEMAPEVAAESVAFSPRLEDWPCELWIPAGDVAGETIHCGYVVVPAERDNSESKETKLAYVLLQATGDNPSPDPIIHISGGPGVSATTRENVVELNTRYAPLRETHDIILYDQRGIGNSQPAFDCSNFIENDGDEVLLSREDEFSRCQEGMRNQGYPPESFSTAVSAADLVDVMRVLGYPAYNLYGISYGSRLLMSLMHYFPDDPLVRSIVLDSVDTLPEDFGTEFRSEPHLLQQTMFESVFDECAANPACAEAYPDLRARFSALVEQLNQTPIALDEETTVDGDTLYRYFYPYSHEVQNIAYQPRMIAELEQGIATTLDLVRFGDIPESATRFTLLPPWSDMVQELGDLYLKCEDDPEIDSDAILARQIGLWDAEVEEVAAFLNDVCQPQTAAAAIQIVEKNPRIFNNIVATYASDGIESPNHGLNGKLYCTELFPFREDFSEIEADLRQAQMPDFFIEETIETLNSYAEGCEAWEDALSAPTPDSYGDYPTLILNGQFDRLTPPAWAETAAAAIPQAQYVPIPNAVHSIMGMNGDCPTEITRQFLADPHAPVDDGCTEGMKAAFLPPSAMGEEVMDKSEEVTAASVGSIAGRIVAGVPWFLTRLQDGVGESVVIEEADRALSFSVFDFNDGPLQGVLPTNCAVDSGAVSFEGDAFSYVPEGEIDETCDLGSPSGRFLQAMRSADKVQLDKELLTISFADGAGVLELVTKNYAGSWDEVLEKGVAACGAPGAVLLVDNPSGRYLRAIGLASREDEMPMQTGDHFEIGSNSKSFTDVLAVQLQEEGVWSLDDPLSQWLPEIAARLPYGDQVTLRQMAQNHSGIWDYADPLITAAVANGTLDQAYTHQELADYIIENGTPVAEPGTDEAWSYSSSNFILLGMAIEAATGKELTDLYQERIFDPLGMTDSFLLEDVPEPGTIVQGYYTQGPGQEPMNTTNENGSQMWAAGGIVSTAEDMARYAQGMAAGSLFQDPASLEQMLDFGDHLVAIFSGYGLGLGKYAALDLNAWGHGGQTAGFETLWAYFPDQQTTVVLLTNDAACSTAGIFFPKIVASPDLLTAVLSE